MRDIGPVAAEIRHDRIAGLGMLAHFARQREQTQRRFEVDRGCIGAFGNARALRLLAFAELHIGTETTDLQRHFLAGAGIDAELARLCTTGLAGFGAELAGEFAFGIVRAADEGAETSELQSKSARAAGGTAARVDAGFAGSRKDVRSEDLIEIVDDLADLQIFGLADSGGEIAPEIAQEFLPWKLAG